MDSTGFAEFPGTSNDEDPGTTSPSICGGASEADGNDDADALNSVDLVCTIHDQDLTISRLQAALKAAQTEIKQRNIQADNRTKKQLADQADFVCQVRAHACYTYVLSLYLYLSHTCSLFMIHIIYIYMYILIYMYICIYIYYIYVHIYNIIHIHFIHIEKERVCEVPYSLC